nr:iron transport multicopper oxidase fet3 [Quercus suber]
MPGLLASFVNVANPTGAEPVPDSALMNDTQNLPISVQPGKTYYFRLTNMGAFAGQYFWIEGHNMTIIEVDGVYTEPAVASQIYLTAAQRYGFLVTTRNDTSANFPITSSMDEDLFDTVPDSLNPNVTGWLVYDKTADMPAAQLLDEWAPFDDFTLVSLDGLELYDTVDQTITLNLSMNDLGDGAN